MISFVRMTTCDSQSGLSGQKRAEIKPQDATSSNRMTRRSGDRNNRSTTFLGSAEMRSKIASSTTRRRVAPNRRNQTERCR
jgi:hypothetical protein